ncbi:MAG: CDP-alcohol phosphatidyltransferase family protein [Zavarzinella sp.]
MADPSYQPVDRRPIAAREWKFSHRLTDVLVKLGISANAISLAGMGAGILAGGCLYATGHLPGMWWLWLLAALLIAVRLLANMLDGMVAIASNTASKVGELYNELPDRISDSCVLIGLGYAHGGNSTLGYIAALVALFTAYLRTAGKAAGTPHYYCGPMAKQHRMAVVIVAAIYCAFPRALVWHHESYDLPAIALMVIVIGSAITSFRRLWRISHQLREAPQ